MRRIRTAIATAAFALVAAAPLASAQDAIGPIYRFSGTSSIGSTHLIEFQRVRKEPGTYYWKWLMTGQQTMPDHPGLTTTYQPFSFSIGPGDFIGPSAGDFYFDFCWDDVCEVGGAGSPWEIYGYPGEKPEWMTVGIVEYDIATGDYSDVVATVELQRTVTPEPATVALLGGGLLALGGIGAVRWRKRA